MNIINKTMMPAEMELIGFLFVISLEIKDVKINILFLICSRQTSSHYQVLIILKNLIICHQGAKTQSITKIYVYNILVYLSALCPSNPPTGGEGGWRPLWQKEKI